MSEHEPNEREDIERKPAEEGGPWAKTSSGDTEHVTPVDDENKDSERRES